MKLYGYWRSSCSYRVRIALGLKALDYHNIPVHLLGGEQQSEDFSSKNPMQQLPCLELDSGQRLTQSIAIMEYLDEVWPDPPLLPRDALPRAQARALAEVINSGIQPLQNMSVLKRIAELGADRSDWSRHFIGQGLAAVEAMAADSAGRFLVGDSPTIADICLVPQLYNARRFELPVESLPTLVRVDAACAELDAFQTAHPDRQPDAVPAK